MALSQKPKRPVKTETSKRALKSAPRKGGVAPLKKQKRRKKWLMIGGSAVVLFFLAVFLTPPFGSIRYGICKTYVELNDPYPQSLQFVQAEEIGTAVILDYNRIDSFGQRTLNQIRCIFNEDPRIVLLTRIDVNGRNEKSPLESEDLIKKFNTGIPALIARNPSLVLPDGLPRNIKDYNN